MINAKYLKYFIDHDPVYHDYNAVSGKRIFVADIAEIVRKKMGNPYPVEIIQKG